MNPRDFCIWLQGVIAADYTPPDLSTIDEKLKEVDLDWFPERLTYPKMSKEEVDKISEQLGKVKIEHPIRVGPPYPGDEEGIDAEEAKRQLDKMIKEDSTMIEEMERVVRDGPRRDIYGNIK